MSAMDSASSAGDFASTRELSCYPKVQRAERAGERIRDNLVPVRRSY